MQGSRNPSQDCDSDAHDRKRLRQVSPSSIPSPTHEKTKQLCVPFTYPGGAGAMLSGMAWFVVGSCSAAAALVALALSP
jgi:hypothetical protein